MTTKQYAKTLSGWFRTLGGQLTILLLVSLMVGQAATIFYLVEVHERDRAFGVDQAFFATLLRSSQVVQTLDPDERGQFLRSVAAGGLSYWVAPGPVIAPDETKLDPEAPPLPEAWELVASEDKRAVWYADARPFSMRYRVYTPPTAPSGRLTEGDIPPDADSPAGLEEVEMAPAGAPLMGAGSGPRQRPPGNFGPEARSPGDGPPRGAKPGLDGPQPDGPRPDGPRPDALDGPPGPGGEITNPAYGEAAARRPGAGFGSPPVRWRASIQLPDGAWLNGEYNQMAGLPVWVDVILQQNLIVLVFTGTIIVLSIALTTKRLATLARAADRVGRGDTLEPIPESGTTEVRGLTQAFNTMSLRLRRFIEGRTQMLGAISHDLRTPITGLRLRAELVDDEENRERMLAIIDELHHLTEATLALAREDSILERTDRVDITALIESVCDDLHDVGMDISCTVERGISTTCRPFSLRRAIRNLAENGVKYGKRTRIDLKTMDKQLLITVDDDGPGIPEDQLEKALLPFVRLETSRSRETGGAGLGLAITRSIILNHGGELKLANRPAGGLRATITLPLDA